MASKKLISVVAVRRAVKTRVYTITNEVNKLAGKAPLFAGISKTYAPREDGAVHNRPAEEKGVQLIAEDLLRALAIDMSEFWDLSATQEFGNTVAKGDLSVQGRTLLKDVPTGTLLFLEKQITDLRTIISNLPTLDPADEWTTDATTNVSRSKTKETVSSEKAEDTIIVVPATAQHPAQTRDRTKDIIVGTWSTVKFSGALPVARQHELIMRANRLLDAIKITREEANLVTVEPVNVSKALFTYLLGEEVA